MPAQRAPSAEHEIAWRPAFQARSKEEGMPSAALVSALSECACLGYKCRTGCTMQVPYAMCRGSRAECRVPSGLHVESWLHKPCRLYAG